MSRSKVAAIRVPVGLLQDVDRQVGPRQRSRFFIEAAQRELKRLEQQQALQNSVGLWRSQDHGELPDTVADLGLPLRHERSAADRLP